MSSAAPKTPVAATPNAPGTLPCPSCGSSVGPEQAWCLECGAAARTRIVAARGWRAPLVIVGLVVTLAGAAVAIALVSLSDDATTAASTLSVAAAPTATAAVPVTAPVATAPPVTNPPVATAPSAPPPRAAAAVGAWPSGKSGYTVVLLSSMRSGAEAKARSLAASGTKVGVLDSSKYASLNPGYFVVFSGRYATRDQAQAAAGGLRSTAAGAYVRFVKPR